jgi:hypothetical protein
MTQSADSPRFGTIFFTVEDGGIMFEVEDARLEVSREVSTMGRRTGASLEVRVHIILDLNTGSGINDAAIKLFNISIQPNDVVQKFKVEWRNPASGALGQDSPARELSFSGWVCGYELYRPETTGTSSFGTSDATASTRLGRADQLLHATFAVVVDDDNFSNLVLSS